MAMMAAVGLGLKLTSQIATGFQEAQAAEHNANRSRENAILSRKNAAEEARLQNVFSRKVLGDIRANTAANGLRFSGSAKDVYAASAAASERDYRNIIEQGEARARGLESDAGLYDSQARTAPWAGGLSAAGTLFSGGAQWKKDYY